MRSRGVCSARIPRLDLARSCPYVGGTMPKYVVIGRVAATVSEEVVANSPEEAADKAELYAGICYQCSGVVEIGDVYERCVLDEKCQNELWTDAVESEAERDVEVLAAYLKDKKRLPADIKAIVERWSK